MLCPGLHRVSRRVRPAAAWFLAKRRRSPEAGTQAPSRPPRSARSAIVTLQQLKELVLRMFCKDKCLGIMIAHDIEGRAYTCFKDKCGAAGRARSLDSALDSMTNFVLTVSAITEEANT